jgi:hypothetical protein
MTRLLQSAVRNFGAEAAGVAMLSGGMAAMSCGKELKMAKKSLLFVKEQDKSTKKSVFPQVSNSAKAKIAAGVVGVATLFGACNNDAGPMITPQVCTCPAGTFHNEGAACCGGINCVCKEAYNVSLGGKQIRVEDKTDLVSKADIEAALASIDSPVDDCVVHFKAMNKNPIMVIENTHNLRVEDSKFFIGIDRINQNGIESAIYEAIIYIYNDGDQRMTKLSDKEIINLGKQFDSSRETVHLSFAAGRQGRQA